MSEAIEFFLVPPDLPLGLDDWESFSIFQGESIGWIEQLGGGALSL